jgi:transposase
MKPLVTDELWAMAAPLLPRRRAQPKGGRPWVDDRATLNGILYVLRTGIAWKDLATELGWGSGVTCWRRLRDWQRRGVWRKLHQVMLERLAAAHALEWTRASLDSRSLAARKGSRRRPEPDQQREALVEAPRPRRPAGSPVRGRADGRQPPRQPGARAAAQRRRADPNRAPGPPATPPGEAPRRQGERLPPLQRAAAWSPVAAWRRGRGRPGPVGRFRGASPPRRRAPA